MKFCFQVHMYWGMLCFVYMHEMLCGWFGLLMNTNRFIPYMHMNRVDGECFLSFINAVLSGWWRRLALFMNNQVWVPNNIFGHENKQWIQATTFGSKLLNLLKKWFLGHFHCKNQQRVSPFSAQHHSYSCQHRCSRNSSGWPGHHGDCIDICRLANRRYYPDHCSGLVFVSTSHQLDTCCGLDNPYF